MKESKNIKKELHELAPFLASIEKSKGDAVPEGYFESLPNIVLQKARLSSTVKNPDTLHFIRIMRHPATVGIAASFLILYFFLPGIFNPGNGLNTKGVKSHDLIEYVFQDVSEFDEQLLLDMSNDKETFENSTYLFEDETIESFLEENIDKIDPYLFEDIL